MSSSFTYTRRDPQDPDPQPRPRVSDRLRELSDFVSRVRDRIFPRRPASPSQERIDQYLAAGAIHRRKH